MPHNSQIVEAILNNDSRSLRNELIDIEDTPNEINALNDNNESYLHIAAQKLNEATDPSYLFILELLLANGINSALRNRQEKTALELCHLNQLNLQPPPLIRAAQVPLPHLFNLLLNYAVDVNKTAEADLSAVCVAAAMTPSPVRLTALLNAQADIFIGYGIGFNPLAHALNRLDDLYQKENFRGSEKDKNELIDSLKQCISILLDKNAGMGLSFNAFRFAVKNIDFSRHILLGAEFNDRIITEIPSLKRSIRTITDLEKMLKTQQNPFEILKKIKLCCLTIAQACIKSDRKMHTRINTVIAELDRKWPELKTVILNKEYKPDDSPPRDNNKPSVISKLVGLFKSQNQTKESSSSPNISPPSSSSVTPQSKG